MTTPPAPALPAQPPAAAQDGLAPIPPRYWWLKRIGLAVGVLIVALAGLRWYWGVVAEQRWRAAVAALEATGEPLYAKDFVEPAVPDEENAAYFLKAAAAKLQPAPGGVSFSDMADAPGWADRAEERANALATNRETLDLVRRARGAARVNWGLDYGQGLARAPNTVYLHTTVEVARLVYLHARVAHEDADQRVAFDDVLDLLHQAWAVSQYRPLLGPLLAVVIADHALWTIERIAPVLTIADAANGTPSRAEIRDLIQNLLEETALEESWRAAWVWERAASLELVRGVAEVRARPTAIITEPVAWVLTPAFRLDAVRVLEFHTGMVRASEATNAVETLAKWPAGVDFSDKLARYARLLSAFVISEFSSTVRDHFEHAARRRLAAARLAIRLYEIDHGAPPETLGQLVPDYLPAVPIDPLFDDGREIGYEPRGPEAALFAGAPRHYEDELARIKGRRLSGLARYPVSLRLDGNRTRAK